MKHLSLVPMLLLASCQSDRPFPKVVPGPGAVEPLWSTFVGCSGGIGITPDSVSVASRSMDEYETGVFDAASGSVIHFSYTPTRISGAPNDTPADLTSGSVKPLHRSRTSSVTPEGFSPVVLTDRFLFAKRTRLLFRPFHFYSEGQVVVLDLQSRNVVWSDEGLDITVLAASGRIVVCSDRRTSVFANNAGRPSEISEFYAAIRAAKVAAIRGLYPAWRKSGMRDVDGKVPLSVAAKDGHLDIVKLLVELGESPNAADAYGFTPLMIACPSRSAHLMMALLWNHADVADFLLDAGAIPTNDGPLWGSALRIAVCEGRRPIISHLLRSGANMDSVQAWSGHTALHEAVMCRNYEAIETLIAAGDNAKVRDKDGKTPAELAPTDQCVVHLFSGGLIKDKPAICQPVKRETGTFDIRGFLH